MPRSGAPLRLVLENGSTTMSQRINPPYGEPGGEFAQRREQLRQAGVLPKIDFRSPDSLTPNPRNPRTHSRRQIRQIAESIKAFGHLVPILIDEKGVVLAGHGRLAAANLLGLHRADGHGVRPLRSAEARILDRR